jgi:HEPN domain-containing protein
MKKTPEEESSRWLKQAEIEFDDAEELRKRGRYYLALFHFQQAAEKALKACLYLELSSVEVFFTHSIDELLGMIKELDADFEKVMSSKKLDRYYIPTRYPNGLPGGIPATFFDDSEEAGEAMRLARDLIDVVKEKMR